MFCYFVFVSTFGQVILVWLSLPVQKLFSEMMDNGGFIKSYSRQLGGLVDVAVLEGYLQKYTGRSGRGGLGVVEAVLHLQD